MRSLEIVLERLRSEPQRSGLEIIHSKTKYMKVKKRESYVLRLQTYITMQYFILNVDNVQTFTIY